tara:strand:+ start:882 stop:1541 length:660 start_codon:yes stop_codon:yes gene_type:complete
MAEYEEFYGQEEYEPLRLISDGDINVVGDPMTTGQYEAAQRRIADALRERQAALTGLEGQREALLGGIAGEREAAEASIRAARQGAARSMMGLAGGTGGLAGSGAVRAGLAQSGFEAANKEQMARQTAAKNIMGIQTQAQGMLADIEEARSAATPESLRDEAVAEAYTQANEIYAANVAGGSEGLRRAISQLSDLANKADFPEARAEYQNIINALSAEL